MRRIAIMLGVGAAAFCLSGAASAHVDLGLYFGLPAPVYEAPPVVYQAPVYEPPPVYAPGPVVYWGGYRHDDDWHRRWHDNGWHRGWRHHDDDDD